MGVGKSHAKFRHLADQAAESLAPNDQELRASVQRLLVMLYRMIDAIVRPN